MATKNFFGSARGSLVRVTGDTLESDYRSGKQDVEEFPDQGKELAPDSMENPTAIYSVGSDGPSGLTLAERSPLWMVSQEPLLNELVAYLVESKRKIESNPTQPQVLRFSHANIDQVRTSFDQMILRGEKKLHKLCEILCHTFFPAFKMESVVIGEVESNHERFTLIQGISIEDLHSTTDLDLGNRQLKKLKFFDGTQWSAASLVANMVEYLPTEPNELGVHRLISRIKAEEEIWNKVVDEIFGIDSLTQRDKKLWHLSRFVKDVFGIKCVVGSAAEALRLQSFLSQWTPATDLLSALGVESSAESNRLRFIEVKNYLGDQDRKQSGWEALKSVVMWQDRMMEIQVQPLRNFWRERELLTKESHAGFKGRRESVRDQIAAEIPLFRFYRDLLRWIFLDQRDSPPMYPGVTVQVEG